MGGAGATHPSRREVGASAVVVAILAIALAIIALNFLLYPFGLEATALIFYSLFPVGDRLLGVGERPWMVGGFVVGAIVLAVCIALLFAPRAAAVDVMARWSLFSSAFGAEQFIQTRIGLRTVYANAFVCFVAPALMPALVWRYTRAGLRNYPFKNTTQNVEFPAAAILVIVCGGLLLKFHYMVMPLTPQAAPGLPPPAFYVPLLDVYADGGWSFFAVVVITVTAAILSAAGPTLVRRIIADRARLRSAR